MDMAEVGRFESPNPTVNSLRKMADILDQRTVHGLEIRQIQFAMGGPLRGARMRADLCALAKIAFAITGNFDFSDRTRYEVMAALPGTDYQTYSDIINMNDNRSMSFGEIAEKLRAKANNIESAPAMAVAERGRLRSRHGCDCPACSGDRPITASDIQAINLAWKPSAAYFEMDEYIKKVGKQFLLPKDVLMSWDAPTLTEEVSA